MSAQPRLADAEIDAWLQAQGRKELLRFITCGSVDDGKSTLIGRLLYESQVLLEDQLAVLQRESRRLGTQGGELDFALLVDGLAAEREQGITIDVAYRFFSTERRKYIVADTPGHEQYTRNMVTGASTAELAVLLVDARKGVLTQTRRHSYLAALLGIRRVVLAVNKLDLTDYSQQAFEAIEGEYRGFAARLGFRHVSAIPMSALRGENVGTRGEHMPWYRGPTLLEYLETVPVGEAAREQPLRLPVQWVNRPNSEFRGVAGLIVSGSLQTGDPVRVLPAGHTSRVAQILGPDGEQSRAGAGESVTVVFDDAIDVGRGDLICSAEAPAAVADQLEAALVWMSEEPMLPGRAYLLKCATRTVGATVAPLHYKINVNTLEQLAARQLELNEIGQVNLSLEQPMAFDPYEQNRDTGGYILIDRLSGRTVGAGLLRAALQRGQNLHWQALEVGKASRSAQKRQRSCVLWFTGLSGAGKSTIANLVEKQLFALGRHSYMLDGDNVRHGLNRDLGFSDADRVENIRRVAEVARLMADAGLIVLVSFISPFRSERRLARALQPPGEFFEVFVDTPLAEAERRDPKGLYRKARAGQIANFTGIDSPYEAPESPELRLNTTEVIPEQAAARVIELLRAAGMIDREAAFIP